MVNLSDRAKEERCDDRLLFTEGRKQIDDSWTTILTKKGLRPFVTARFSTKRERENITGSTATQTQITTNTVLNLSYDNFKAQDHWYLRIHPKRTSSKSSVSLQILSNRLIWNKYFPPILNTSDAEGTRSFLSNFQEHCRHLSFDQLVPLKSQVHDTPFILLKALKYLPVSYFSAQTSSISHYDRHIATDRHTPAT